VLPTIAILVGPVICVLLHKAKYSHHDFFSVLSKKIKTHVLGIYSGTLVFQDFIKLVKMLTVTNRPADNNQKWLKYVYESVH
jgi:hypothetical protein